jgi:hypothetical protein
LQNELGGITTNDSLPPTQKKRKVGQKAGKNSRGKGTQKKSKTKGNISGREKVYKGNKIYDIKKCFFAWNWAQGMG